jgi:hypothetical protein
MNASWMAAMGEERASYPIPTYARRLQISSMPKYVPHE